MSKQGSGQKISGLASRVIRSASFVSAGVILIMALGTTLNAILRYFFRAPIRGMIEFNELLMVAVVYLVIAETQAGKQNATVKAFVSRFKPRTRLWIFRAITVLALALVLTIMWQTGLAAYSSAVTGEYRAGEIAFPLWPSKFLVPIGCFLLSVQLILDLISGPAKESNEIKLEEF